MFFDYDMKVKNLLADLNRGLSFLRTSEDLVEYEDKMQKSLEEMEYYLYCMTNKFRKYNLNSFQSFIAKIKEEFKKSCGDFRKMEDFYNRYMALMREEFYKSVGESYSGHALFSGPGNIPPVSINEYLHDLHTDVMNNNYIFTGIPSIENEALSNSPVHLRGKSDERALALAVSLANSNLKSRQIDVLNLSNKILIMVRDYGHATTIEIRFEHGMAIMNYFVPKVTNYLLANELPGLTNKVTPETKFIRGIFEVPEEELVHRLPIFIEKIPTDDAFRLPGGILYDPDNSKHIA